MALDPANRLRVLPAPEAQRPGSVEEASSRVQQRTTEPLERAAQRVGEFLRALGLSEPKRIQALAQEIAAHCARSGDVDHLPEAAVAAAQERVQHFWHAVFGEQARSIDPLWFREFAAAMPSLFLGEVEEARRAALRFGNPQLGRGPSHASFRDQHLEPLRVPRWLLGLLLPFVLTSAATGALLAGMREGGLTPLEGLWATLFAFLFGFAAVGCCVAVYGFFARSKRPERAASDALKPLPRSALLMPIYHESAEDVFAALAAMRESLENTPGGDAFEIFVLSDSRDAERAAEEERAFRRVVGECESRIPVYYRRRVRNERQKAGNLAEFFERWGHRYTYAVVLDADSLMRGDTLVEMVRRMEEEPRLALLQAPLTLHRGETLFARVQQVAASVCGPIFTRGLSVWAGRHGNYYGHNAVLRVQAFLDCCALPELRGEPPLGGHILSHDFVEAALLCRAGWEVRIAHDLAGSWEELPPTLHQYVARDRRWCQGNLQHVKVAFSQGFAAMSRLHMAFGIASYLAGPAWLAFVGIGLTLAVVSGSSVVPAQLALGLTLLTATVLLLPRLLGALHTLRDRDLRRGHGGASRLLASVGLETLVSTLVAPLMMLHHTRIVFSILAGRSVRWGPQQRKGGGQLSQAVHAEWPTTLLGVGLVAGLACFTPHLVLYLAPLWLSWCLAIPLSLLVSSTRAGQFLRRMGLLSVPSETEPDELALRALDLRALTTTDEAARFRDLVLDPVLVNAHVARLEAGGQASSADPQWLARLCERALRVGPAGLTALERRALSQDAESMRLLHREAWRKWPVESWRLSRERPQLPPETD